MARFEFLATIGIAGLISGGMALGCGPFYEAPPPTLDYFIKQVPAKSFGAIVDHSVIDKSLPVSIDFAINDLGKQFALSAKPSDRVHAVDDGWPRHVLAVQQMQISTCWKPSAMLPRPCGRWRGPR